MSSPPAIAGPGARSITTRKQDRFGKGTKGKTWQDADVPGPGTYSLREVVGAEGTRPTIKSRRPDTSPKYGIDSPGPGSYEVAGIKPRPTSFTMGRGERNRQNLEASRVPSPLQYRPSDALLRPASPVWRYGPISHGNV